MLALGIMHKIETTIIDPLKKRSQDPWRRTKTLNKDQAYCVEQASRWMTKGGPDYAVDVWLFAASCPQMAKQMRESGLAEFGLRYLEG